MAEHDKRADVVGEILDSFARLGDIYVVEIKHEATGFEWCRVGEDLSVAMEECAKELPEGSAPAPVGHDELVEA